MIRIAFVGAGSVVFTRQLLHDILSFPELADCAIALHDIDPERLEVAAALAKQAAETLGANPTVTTSVDRRAALAGADVVVNMVAVGGHDATVTDFTVPAAAGLRQTIGDTLGVGGIFRALRTFPLLEALAADMLEVCPQAWLLNYTNPMAMLCWSVWASGRDTRIVGLCHSVQNTHEQIAEIVGVPEPEVEYLTAGVNHQAWVLRFERDGESLYPLLDEAIARDPDGLGRRVRVELYRQFGHFPTESSEHSAEYLPWFMSHDDQLDRYRIPVDEYLRRSEDNLREYAEIKGKLAAGEPLEVLREGELAPRYIHAMATGAERVEYGNVRNDDLIDNLPAGCCVEVPCRIDAEGVHPIAVGALPSQCAALNRTMVNVADLTVQAVLEGRRDHVYQAVMLDPNAGATLTIAQIHAMVDELIEAHGDLLPEGIRATTRV